MAKAPKSGNSSNDEPKPKRTRGPRKQKGPQLDAQDYAVLVTEYDKRLTAARIDESVTNDEFNALFQRFTNAKTLYASAAGKAPESILE